MSFIPPSHIKYTVNGVTADDLTYMGSTTKRLKSVLASGIGEPLRKTYRNSKVDIFRGEGAKGKIYEMGILIQEIDAPYYVNIHQKVPMPPNRDTVTEAYLQDIYSAILDVAVDYLEEAEASESWVQKAVEDELTPDEVVSKVMAVKLPER